MTTSRIPAIIDALIATLTAGLSSSVVVIDGPPVNVPDGDFVTVGWTPDGQQATSTQSAATAGTPRSRDEAITIPCYCDSYSGSTATKVRRDAAFALLAVVESALRTDPTLGGAVPRNLPAELTEVTLRQEQTKAGFDVGVIFHVHVPRARI